MENNVLALDDSRAVPHYVSLAKRHLSAKVSVREPLYAGGKITEIHVGDLSSEQQVLWDWMHSTVNYRQASLYELARFYGGDDWTQESIVQIVTYIAGRR